MNDNQRHLKRQFLEIQALPEDVINLLESSPNRELTKKEKKKKQQSALISEHGDYIKAFLFNTIPIPTAHPVPIYYDMALRQSNYLKNQKREIIDEARANRSIEDMLRLLFYYFGSSSVFASQLTASLECFVNLMIKDDTKYTRQKDLDSTKDSNVLQRFFAFFFKTNKNKELTGEEIIWVPLREKIEFLIPELTDKNDFNSKFPKGISNIRTLINYRNKCIHPTKDEEFAMDNYENLYRNCLTFNYDSALKSVKDFINYYSKEPIIEECFCYENRGNE